MKNYLSYVPAITKSLQQIDPYRVYLFGSVASGQITNDSDIDIAVILDTDKMAKTYDEKLETRVTVRKSLMAISVQVPIDILVYSRPEFEKLKEINPGFAREVEKGKVIYEKVN